MALDTATGRLAELLTQLIRNACVNQGNDRDDDGEERRNAELLASLLPAGAVELVNPDGQPQRTSLVARLDGSDPDAPTLLLIGHTDVVPVNPAGWRHDPFGGELIDGEIWGRGAVDMLNQTAAMALTFADVAAGPDRLRGTLILAAVADEECGGTYGTAHLLRHRPELLRCDVALTEPGGAVTRTAQGPVVGIAAGEKGTAPTRIVVRGRAGPASTVPAADNALVTAAEVVRRLAVARPATHIGPVWRDWVAATVEDHELRARLLDPHHLWDDLDRLPDQHRTLAHAATHTTYTPTRLHGGGWGQLLPDRVTVGVDVRIVWGETSHDVESFLDQLLADLPVTVSIPHRTEASRSDPHHPIWAALGGAVRRAHPGGRVAPTLFTGATDGKHLRALGVPAFGFGVLSAQLDPATYWSRFHGNDERIDLESLRLSVAAWHQVVRDFLG